MADDLDLTKGDPSLTGEEGTRRRRRRRSTTTEGEGRSTDDGPVTGQLKGVFERIAVQREVKDDEELATAIREESDAMTAGLLSLTRNVPVLRGPLIIILNLIEPLLAFGRVLRILRDRFNLWRYQRSVVRAAAQSNMSVEEYEAAVAANGDGTTGEDLPVEG